MSTHFFFRVLLICTLSLPFNINAQSAKSLIKRGKALLKDGNHWGAYPTFQSAEEEEPGNVIATFYMGVCELLLENPSQAKDRLESVDASQLEGEPYYYWLGRAYFADTQFDKASRSLELYLASEDKQFVNEAQQFLDNIKNAKELYAMPEDYVIENLGSNLNSNFQDYNALVMQDHKTIIFTSKREGNLGGTTGKGQNFEDILTSTIDDKGRWSAPTKFEGFVTEGHDAAVHLYGNDNKLIIYKDGDLFVTEKGEDGNWGQLSSLGKEINNKKSFESHACLSKDESLIIFSSNNGVDNGNLDLFYAVKDDKGGWGEPKPITVLNTPQNEDAPFLSADGTLYFSSQGHSSIGGYDVYKSAFDNANLTWAPPQNMGYPVNSVMDDIFFTKDGEIGYLTSNRSGSYGKEDIFRVYLFSKMNLDGTIVNKADNLPIPNATVKFVPQGEGKAYEVTANKAGMFQLQLPFNEKMRVKIYDGEEVIHEEDYLAKVYIGVAKNQNKKFMVDLSEGEGADGALTSDKAVNEYINNLKPSGNAKLLVAGRVFDRISKRPMAASVELIDASSGEVVLSTTAKANGLYKLDIVDDAINYKVRASYSKYLTETRQVNLAMARDKVVREDLSLVGTSIGQTFVIQRIYFDFNQSVLREVSYKELDKVKNFLEQNPDLYIEISGHSDNVGTPAYNLMLSERRAKTVKDYLVKNGIDGSRLTVKGYGEKQPLVSNDDEINGREINRRIELKVIQN